MNGLLHRLLPMAAGLLVAFSPMSARAQARSGGVQVPDCADPAWTARRLFGLEVGEALSDRFDLSGAGVLPGHCRTVVLQFSDRVDGTRLDIIAQRTEHVLTCACRTRNFCLTFRAPGAGEDLKPLDVPPKFLRETCLVAGERDRGILTDYGPRNAAYRWVLVVLALAVIVGTLWALSRQVLSPETPRYIAPALGAIVLLAAVLRYFLSPWGFLHEYFHFGNTIESYLYGDLLDTHGEVGPALYRAVEIFFGLEEASVFGTNAFLAMLTVLALAWLDFSLFRSWPRALFSAFVLAVLPHHLRVSASEDLFVPMVLFAVCGLAAGVRYLETGKRWPLALSATALFLTMQSRPEGALTLVLLALLVVAGARRGWLRAFARRATWVALGALAGAVALQRTFFASRAEDLVQTADLLYPPWPQLWLRPDVTSMAIPALGIAGLVAAWRARDPIPWWFLFAGEVTIYAALIFFHGSPTYILRSQTAAIPYCVLLAGSGFEFLRGFARGHRPATLALSGVIAFVVIEGTAVRVPFVTEETPDENVMEFIRDTVLDLPEGPGVTLLARAVFSPFPREYIWRKRKLIRMVELERWVRGDEPGLTCENLIVFEAPGCFLGDSRRVTADVIAPECAAIRRACRLEPIATKTLDIPEDYGQARFGGRTDPVVIGFYRAIGPMEAPP